MEGDAEFAVKTDDPPIGAALFPKRDGALASEGFSGSTFLEVSAGNLVASFAGGLDTGWNFGISMIDGAGYIIGGIEAGKPGDDTVGVGEVGTVRKEAVAGAATGLTGVGAF